MSANEASQRMRARIRGFIARAAVLAAAAATLSAPASPAWAASGSTAAHPAAVRIDAAQLHPAQISALQAGSPSTAAFFVDAAGALESYGLGSAGTWTTAAPVAPAGLTPAGAAVAAFVTPGGEIAAAFVGDDGSLYVTCPSSVPIPVAGGPFAAGSAVAAAAADGTTTIVVTDAADGAVTPDQDTHDPCTIPGGPFAPKTPLPGGSGSGSGNGSDARSDVRFDALFNSGSGSGPAAAPAVAALPDGTVGVFTADSAGALHVGWLAPSGTWRTAVLAPAGSVGAGGGIAVAVGPGAAPDVSVFYVGPDGLVYLAQTAEAAGQVAWTPHVEPWGAGYAVGQGGRLAATTALAGRTDVGYVDSAGAVVDLTADTAGAWLSAAAATAAGFAAAGEPIAAGSSAADAGAFDLYCADASGRPYRIPIGPAGPGTAASAGPVGRMTSTYGIAGA